ncbi:hypothetical protein FKP32DRAFT_1191258 [Trametes sanguinea]|nr:hypothetical protein FKP32DRAFT_1191258 [Trametes sanguinea]
MTLFSPTLRPHAASNYHWKRTLVWVSCPDTRGSGVRVPRPSGQEASHFVIRTCAIAPIRVSEQQIPLKRTRRFVPCELRTAISRRLVVMPCRKERFASVIEGSSGRKGDVPCGALVLPSLSNGTPAADMMKFGDHLLSLLTASSQHERNMGAGRCR